jgi:hypothetical protein
MLEKFHVRISAGTATLSAVFRGFLDSGLKNCYVSLVITASDAVLFYRLMIIVIHQGQCCGVGTEGMNTPTGGRGDFTQSAVDLRLDA